MNFEAHAGADMIALSDELDPHLDARALYAGLSANGTRADTMLFEQSDGLSIILDQAAVRIECRGGDVALGALTRNGRKLLEDIGHRFTARVSRHGIDRLNLDFPRSHASDCEERLKAPSPFDVFRAVTSQMSCAGTGDLFSRTALGIIAFDHVDFFEELPANAEDPLDFPDFVFWVPESLIVFEAGRAPRAIAIGFSGEALNSEQLGQKTANRLADLKNFCRKAQEQFAAAEPRAAPGDADVAVDLDDQEFARLVTRLKEHVAAGDVYQIVASRTFSAPCPDPFAAFERLRAIELSPYSFFVAGEDFHLFGASPETSVRLFEEDGLNVELKPIAGTRRRGCSADEDDRLEAELRLDPKELAEHMMLVDLARNDVARISEPGTRRVSQMMAVERYARVMHLVSRVTGKLRSGLDSIGALKACLNMGTLTGAPKIRATELLREAERTKRGPYGGAIGWLRGDGVMDSAILIRSAIVRGGTAYVRAGAGIVHDSDPKAEADETRRKASAILSVLGGAEA
jgi:anthranilate synthase component 1